MRRARTSNGGQRDGRQREQKSDSLALVVRLLTLKPSPSLRPGSDGSDPEGFPTRQQLSHAVSLAVLTGLIGFCLSYSIFVHPINDLHFNPIDRSRAEQPPPLAYSSEGQGNSSDGGDAYFAGGLLSMPAPERGPNLELSVATPVAAPSSTPTQTPTPTPVPSATASSLPVDNPNDVPQPGRPRHTGPASPAHSQTSATATPDASAAQALRHAPVSQDDAWKLAQPSLFQMMGSDGAVGAGVIVDPSGLAVTSLSNLNSEGLSRIQLGPQVLSASLLARDPEHDVALLQLVAGNYPAIALDADPPRAGEVLSMPAGSDPGHYQDAKVMTVSTRDYFRFRGVQSDSANGVALVNNRGELTGIGLGRPSGFPGQSHGIGIDAASIKVLLDARKDLGGAARPVAQRVAQLLLDSVPEISTRTVPTQSNGKIRLGEAVGNYPLGLTLQVLNRELGPGQPVSERDGFATVEFSTPRLRFTLVKDRVVAIETEYGFYSTSAGLSAGSVADVNRIKGEAPDPVFGDVRPGVGVAAGIGIEIEANQGKVARLRLVPR